MGLNDNEMLTIDISSRLKQLRSERGKSLRALSRRSGLSTNALSMIERGRTSPSVSTLYKIADALEVPITAFFRLEPPRKQIVLCRSGQRKRVNIPQGVMEGLGGELFTGRIDAFMLSLDVGGSSGPFGMLHTGNEFVMCVSGKLQYEVEEQVFDLDPGDTLIFASQLHHRWRNVGNTLAVALIVLSGFDPGERPSEYHISSGMKAGSQDEGEEK